MTAARRGRGMGQEVESAGGRMLDDKRAQPLGHAHRIWIILGRAACPRPRQTLLRRESERMPSAGRGAGGKPKGGRKMEDKTMSSDELRDAASASVAGGDAIRERVRDLMLQALRSRKFDYAGMR